MFLRCQKHLACNLEELNMGGRGKSKKSSSSSSSQQNNLQTQQAAQQAAQQSAMQRQMEQARQSAESERKRKEAEEAERIRQQQIQAENERAANIRKSAESQLQSNLNNSGQQTKQEQTAPEVVASGYGIKSAQKQKTTSSAGIPMQSAIPAVMSANTGVGGTQQYGNRFAMPNMQGLTFGGV